MLALETAATDNEGIAYLRNLGIDAHLVQGAPNLPPLRPNTVLRALLKRQPITVARYYFPEFKQKLHALLTRNNFDLIDHEYLHTAAYRVKTNLPALLTAHNVDSHIWRRLRQQTNNPARKFIYWTQQYLFERYERRTLPKFDAIACTSETDRAVLQSICPNAAVEVIPNGVDLELYQPNHALEDEAALVFTGSMDWYPNEDAVIYFADEIFPMIKGRRAEAKFYIVGQHPTNRVQKLAERPGIIVTGRVEDTKPYIARATVYVVPLRIGSGTRLKILEALAMEKAVVSTAVGEEGLNLIAAEEIIIADEPARFADAVVQLIGDKHRRRQLGEKGWKRVQADYDWRRIGEKLHQFYESIVKQWPETSDQYPAKNSG